MTHLYWSKEARFHFMMVLFSVKYIYLKKKQHQQTTSQHKLSNVINVVTADYVVCVAMVLDFRTISFKRSSSYHSHTFESANALTNVTVCMKSSWFVNYLFLPYSIWSRPRFMSKWGNYVKKPYTLTGKWAVCKIVTVFKTSSISAFQSYIPLFVVYDRMSHFVG